MRLGSAVRTLLCWSSGSRPNAHELTAGVVESMLRSTYRGPTLLLLAALIVAATLPRSPALAAIDRKSKWEPSTHPLLAAQWRYVAGRITGDNSDYGFVVALTDIK